MLLREVLKLFKIVFHITYGIVDFQTHIFCPTKTKNLA